MSLFFVSMTLNAQNETDPSKNAVQITSANNATKALASNPNANYSQEYETALKLKDELTNRKRTLSDSIKIWNKDLKRLQDNYASLVKSNKNLEEKIKQATLKGQKSESSELQKKKSQLLTEIDGYEKEKALLDKQLQEVDEKLNARNRQRDDLGKIKDNVSNQIIAENKDYLERPFSKMSLSELKQIKSKCQRYSTDSKVNAFVSKIDMVIKNKELYDKMVIVVNSAYNKTDVDRALASCNQVKGVNAIQKKEVAEVKGQLSSFYDGLLAFKQFINSLNEKRKFVNNYKWEFFETDREYIYSESNLGNRIETQLKRVPYLRKRFDEFMRAFKVAPNKHTNVETEILSQ